MDTGIMIMAATESMVDMKNMRDTTNPLQHEYRM